MNALDPLRSLVNPPDQGQFGMNVRAKGARVGLSVGSLYQYFERFLPRRTCRAFCSRLCHQ